MPENMGKLHDEWDKYCNVDMTLSQHYHIYVMSHVLNESAVQPLDEALHKCIFHAIVLLIKKIVTNIYRHFSKKRELRR